MEFRTGNLLNVISDYNYTLYSATSYINKVGCHTIGCGSTNITNMYPNIDSYFGKLISLKCGHLGRYGILFFGTIGLFQVKYNYSNTDDTELISYSTNQLCTIANKHSAYLFALNYATFNEHKLNYNDINQILMTLPNNVHVWRK